MAHPKSLSANTLKARELVLRARKTTADVAAQVEEARRQVLRARELLDRGSSNGAALTERGRRGAGEDG